MFKEVKVHATLFLNVTEHLSRPFFFH